jgi:hypothetical protein
MIAWELVDDFLSARLPEGPRIEYRERFDPAGGGASARRFADTAAAMANSGGGLILIGVRSNEQDIPADWPTLPLGELRPGTLHASIRNYLDPPITIEIGVARDPSKGDVVVVRVPDVAVKPIFVNDKGVLIRIGESNIPARPAQLAEWFGVRAEVVAAVEGELYRAAPQLIGVTKAQVNIAIGPSEPWPDHAWGDATDVLLTAAVERVFPGLGAGQVGTNILQFRRESTAGDIERWVWFEPKGVVLRVCRIDANSEGRVSALQVAGQLQRAWQLAIQTIPVVLPGYRAGLSLVISVGGIGDAGLRSDKPMTSRLQDVLPIRNRTTSWQGVRLGIPQDLDDFEVIRSLMEQMLRSFGYSPSAPVANELAAHSVWREAEPE